MIEDLPILSLNVRIWKLCGFIKFRNYRRSFLISVVPVVMNILEVMHMVKNWRDFEVSILSFFMTSILFNSIIRISSVLVNQEKFVAFMEDIAECHKDAERRRDVVALRTLRTVGIRGDKLSKLSIFLGSIGGFMTAIAPLLLRDGELPYSIWIPGIDIHKSPIWEILYVLQVIFVMPFIVATYIPFTNLFICWLMFGIGSLQVLQIKLENSIVPSRTAEEIHAELADCIRNHMQIIRFRDKLSSMLSFTNFMEFLMFSLMLCVLLFFFIIIDNVMLQVNAVIYILCIFYVILLFYWFANEFSCESLKIAEAAYNSDWTMADKKTKQSILLIILRSQNALQISAGGMYPMTLETFQSLLSSTYSYFTILKGVQQ